MAKNRSLPLEIGSLPLAAGGRMSSKEIKFNGLQQNGQAERRRTPFKPLQTRADGSPARDRRRGLLSR